MTTRDIQHQVVADQPLTEVTVAPAPLAIQARDYGNYANDFERTGKLSGGSSSLGEVC